MPDTAQENAFVETFVLSERRERYMQLLANPKRRKAFLDRLNHNLDYLPNLARKIPGNQHSVEGILRLLNECGMKPADTVYVFSSMSAVDGLHLPLRQALEEVLQGGFGSVVCCVVGKLAYYRPEEAASGYILETP